MSYFSYYIDNPSLEDIIACTRSYMQVEAVAIRKLYNYYNGNQAIKNRVIPEGRPNNRIVTNMARGLVDTTLGFMDFANATTEYNKAEVESIMKDTLITGVGYGLVEWDSSIKALRRIPATKALVIKDTTLAHNPVCGVIINQYNTYERGYTKQVYELFVYDRAYVTMYSGQTLETVQQVSRTAHMLPIMPLLEVRSSLKYEGLYNQVVDLFDSYNLIDSSYANSRETFSESFLLITGQSIDEDSADSLIDATSKIINLPITGSDAKYLIKDDNADQVIKMLDNIKNRVHAITLIPDFDREGSYGQASGKSNSFRMLNFFNLVNSRENLFKATLMDIIDPTFQFAELALESTTETTVEGE